MPRFEGFGPKIQRWFKGLEADNTKEYFSTSREFFEESIRSRDRWGRRRSLRYTGSSANVAVTVATTSCSPASTWMSGPPLRRAAAVMMIP